MNSPRESDSEDEEDKIEINQDIVDKIEKDGAKQVLSSAALTYVASAASSILQLLRLILLSRGRD